MTSATLPVHPIRSYVDMGKLFDMKVRIDEVIAERGLDGVQIRGAIGLKAGMLLGLVLSSTPDDEAKLKRLTEAAREILKTDLTRHR